MRGEFPKQRDQTYPHDYRVLFEGDVKPTLVGGQAVNLWAITYLEEGDPSLYERRYGSEDLDILKDDKVLDLLKSRPEWHFEKTPLWKFSDIRVGQATARAEDGRTLVVEVLVSVKGLSEAELTTTTIEYRGTTYNLLDPIALVKAKAANLRDLKQDDPERPRHDSEHLRLICRCFPRFLTESGTLAAAASSDAQTEFAKMVSRAFKVLTHEKTAAMLRQEDVDLLSLMPLELKGFGIEKVAVAFQHQYPRLEAQEHQALTNHCIKLLRQFTARGPKHPLLVPGQSPAQIPRWQSILRAAAGGHPEAQELKDLVAACGLAVASPEPQQPTT